MHIPPEIWGPIFWSTLHITSLAYPDQPTYAEKRAAKEFYNALVYLLPCPICRDHFREVIAGLPVETWLDNRKSLVDWVWQVHNLVNQRLGKATITKEEFFQRYQEMADRGLPIPPSNPQAEVNDAAAQAAWIRGAGTAVGAVAAVAVVGGLLWMSYKGKN
jgi:hypothetical protein